MVAGALDGHKRSRASGNFNAAAGGEQFGVGRHHDIGLPCGLRQGDAGVRTYPCRFTRRDDDSRYVHYILISTNASSRNRRSHSSVSSSALLSRMAAKARCRRTSSVLS